VAAALEGMERVRLVHNEAPQRGQLSSLQTGIAALHPVSAEWVLFAPVDCMAIDATVMETLRMAMTTADPDVLLCIPRHCGGRGHPVAFRRECASKFLELRQDDTARTLIHSLREQTRYAEIPTADFLLDVDRPEDYAYLLALRNREEPK
jgi:CTP:molybdopterin cytidylyltransferase MocA